MRDVCEQAIDAALGRRGRLRGCARGHAARPARRDEERRGGLGRGRRDRGHRRPRARRRSLGLRLRPPPVRGGSAKPPARRRLRPRERGARATARVELAPVAGANGRVPDAGRARPDRRADLGEDRALPPRRGGMRQDGREDHGGHGRARSARSAPFASSEGADVLQEFVECGGGIEALAIDDGRVQIRSYPSAHGGSSAQAGWEYVEGLELDREAPRVGEEAAALLRADPCPSGVTTIVLDSEQMVLQVHESVGHPTELDRVYGTEAAYAGTSFLKPGDLGEPSLRLRPHEHHRGLRRRRAVSAPSPSTTRACRRAPAGRRGGVLRGFLASRETAALIGDGRGGSMRADGWSRMPLVRMTNLHLEPGRGSLRRPARGRRRRHLSVHEQELVDRRQAAQLPVRDADRLGDQEGQARRMFRDATYMGVTPKFWSGLDAVAGPRNGSSTG